MSEAILSYFTSNKGKAVAKSYGMDWSLLATMRYVTTFLKYIKPPEMEFSVTDPRLSYKYVPKERINMVLLWVLAYIGPIFLGLVFNVLTVKSWWDIHQLALGVTLSTMMAYSVANAARSALGSFSPDFLARCNPPPGTRNPPMGLLGTDICTKTSNFDSTFIIDGTRSFFSVHAAVSFAGLGFLFFYMAGKMRVFDGKGQTGKPIMALFPLGLAGWIAMTRLSDNRHHLENIVISAAVGLFIAYFSYRQYFPDLADPLCDRPKPPRTELQGAIALPPDDSHRDNDGDDDDEHDDGDDGDDEDEGDDGGPKVDLCSGKNPDKAPAKPPTPRKMGPCPQARHCTDPTHDHHTCEVCLPAGTDEMV